MLEFEKRFRPCSHRARLTLNCFRCNAASSPIGICLSLRIVPQELGLFILIRSLLAPSQSRLTALLPSESGGVTLAVNPVSRIDTAGIVWTQIQLFILVSVILEKMRILKLR